MKTETKYFEMSGVCGNKATATTIALFNSCTTIHKDNFGQWSWEAFETKGSGIVAKKMYFKSDKDGACYYKSELPYELNRKPVHLFEPNL
jgi:hypothetical protein